jgi:hypothetical protein
VRALWIFVGAALATAAAVIFTRDPEEPWAVAMVILALGAAAGATATLVLLRRVAGGRGRVAGSRSGPAVRRGAEIAAVVALLLWLRALDGLSVVTAAFVIGTFFAAEVVLSARPRSSR